MSTGSLCLYDAETELSSRNWQTSHGSPSWWRHQIPTIFVLMALCRSPANSPHKRPTTRCLDIFLDLRLNKRLCNRDADDLSRHRTHYDVTNVYGSFQMTPCLTSNNFVPIWINLWYAISVFDTRWKYCITVLVYSGHSTLSCRFCWQATTRFRNMKWHPLFN